MVCWGMAGLAADGDAGVGEDYVAADGGAEESGGLEDAGEKVLLHAESDGLVGGAGEDGVVVDTAIGVYLGFDHDEGVAIQCDGLRRNLGIEEVWRD